MCIFTLSKAQKLQNYDEEHCDNTRNVFCCVGKITKKETRIKSGE